MDQDKAARTYLTAPQLRKRWGGLSDMSLYRWLRDERLNFPKPIVVNRRRYFGLDEIEAFEETMRDRTLK